jgi:light-regulated signal transduction histidine kinase (bacteriophytochrome)
MRRAGGGQERLISKLSETPPGGDAEIPPTRGGDSIRRLVPFAAGAAIALGVLRYVGQKAGLFSLGLGTTLLVIAYVALVVGLLLYVAGIADRTEEERRKAELGPDGNRFIEAITGGVARMDEMISDLLAYARAGRSDQPFEQVDANEVVGEALAGLQRAIDDPGADIEVDRLPTVTGNPAALRQLFQNLVANAIKFVDDRKPQVRIWAAEVPEGWRFSVRDNGIGIASEQAERIFGMFTRLHGSDRYPGTGVGLALCQRIVDVHGGRIWVEPAPGGGSQFMFTIARPAANGSP